MRNDFCSNYLAHARGVEWKNHKYVAKLKLANGKFFYFYSQAQYDSYMNKMKKRNDANREALNEKFGIKKATPKVEAKKNTTVEDSKSKSKKKSGSSSSSKSSGAKSGKSSSSSKSKSSSEEKAKKGSGSSKQSKESTKNTSAKSSANAMTMSKLLRELEAATAVTTKGEETNAAELKETYGVIDNEVSSLNAMKAEQEMNQKYKDGAYGFISVGDKVYKWDKQGGQMHLYDFQSEKEIPFNTIVKGQKQLISEFSIDDKKDRKKTLAHHGILGMKWGVKNGPPYPLGEEDHSAREKKSGYKKSLGGGRNEELYGKSSGSTKKSKPKEKKEFHLTEGQKKAIKIGAAVAATALIAYGGYRLGAADKLGNIGLKGSAAVDRILGRNKGAGNFLNDIDDLSIATGIDKNNKIVSIVESCKKVNPNYKPGGPMEYRGNCFSAVTADIMNRANNGKGLNAVARPATAEELKAGGLSFNKLLKPFDGSEIDDLVIDKAKIGSAKNEAARLIMAKCKEQEGATGILRFKQQPTGMFKPQNGHYIKFEIKDGDVIFSDSLSGTIGADPYFDAIAKGKVIRSLEFARVDGTMVNPFELKKLLG